MKSYSRTEWYGLNYLLMLTGSVMPRCLPAMIVGCLVNLTVSLQWIKLDAEAEEGEEARSAISHPYTFQLVGLIFGYLTIYRINISYARYWEGVTMVKNMVRATHLPQPPLPQLLPPRAPA